MLRSHRREIHESRLLRIDGGQQVIFQHPLVEVDIVGAAGTQPQSFRKFRHVVRIAGFRAFSRFDHG